MEVARLKIQNFRGIQNSELFFNNHTVMVGDNNVDKSTILEAIDLTLGPDRLSRHPVIDEHDFYAGEYIKNENLVSRIWLFAPNFDLSRIMMSHDVSISHFLG